MDPKALEPATIAKMRLLFNNYEEDTTVNEHVTANERKEENDFLDAVMATSVMRQAMLFLQQKGLVTPDPKTHRDLVKELWFTQYSRGMGKIGSSGFEHVFVHEVKNGTIIGFHNWVYVNEEEQAGRFDYKGYMKQQDIGSVSQSAPKMKSKLILHTFIIYFAERKSAENTLFPPGQQQAGGHHVCGHLTGAGTGAIHGLLPTASRSHLPRLPGQQQVRHCDILMALSGQEPHRQRLSRDLSVHAASIMLNNHFFLLFIYNK